MNKSLKNLTMKDIKRKDLLIPFEKVLAEEYDTPEKMRKFKKGFKAFEQECKRELLQELGGEVKKARAKAGVTQEELAKRLKTKKSVISRVEHGDQNLTVEYIIKIAIALGRPFEVRIY
jgi:HTH-type transcriptional regulator/antitoxin HipB